MNWQPFKSKLNKIKMLAETAEQDGQISRLERDLLASYIRDLYESLWEGDAQEEASRRPQTAKQIPVEKPAEVVPPPVKEIQLPKDEEPAAAKPVETPVETKPVEEKIFVSDEKEIEMSAPAKEITLEDKPYVATPTSTKVDASLLAELFIEEKMTDLSGKLSSQKIQDLTKSMGINEKIFTIQELFNNDNNLFNQSISYLNNLTDFEAAKTYISNDLVPRLDWTSERKIKKAATFVKLVRRRFL